MIIVNHKEVKSYMYLTKEDLEKELVDYKASCTFDNETGKIVKRGKVNDVLGKMIMDITKGLASKGNWNGYTWKEDMIGEGMLIILKYMHNFTAGRNPHAYLSMIAQNAFIQYIQRQKRHSIIKDRLYQFDIEAENDYIDKSINYETLLNKE